MFNTVMLSADQRTLPAFLIDLFLNAVCMGRTLLCTKLKGWHTFPVNINTMVLCAYKPVFVTFLHFAAEFNTLTLHTFLLKCFFTP